MILVLGVGLYQDGFILWNRVTLVNFHMSGSFWSWKELFRRTKTGYARISAKSLKIRFGILSGPGAFDGLKDMSFR